MRQSNECYANRAQGEEGGALENGDAEVVWLPLYGHRRTIAHAAKRPFVLLKPLEPPRPFPLLAGTFHGDYYERSLHDEIGERRFEGKAVGDGCAAVAANAFLRGSAQRRHVHQHSVRDGKG